MFDAEYLKRMNNYKMTTMPTQNIDPLKKATTILCNVRVRNFKSMISILYAEDSYFKCLIHKIFYNIVNPD